MKPTIIASLAAIVLGWTIASAQDTDSRFMRPFTENFSNNPPEYFKTKGSDLRYYSGVHSMTEEGTDVLLMRISPTDPPGGGRGPEICSLKSTHFGSYSTRIRIPEVKPVQPDAGIVVGYFTYLFTRGYGLSEIDIEWLVADPELVYLGCWTSDPENIENLQHIGRTVNLATGQILYTNYRSYHDGDDDHPFTDKASTSPETIPAIEGFNAAERFYTYGFDWYPDRMIWWIEHPVTGEKIILWDYTGTTPRYSGIPQSPSAYLLNFWHTEDWPAATNPNSVETPKYPYFLEVDWMRYEPFDDLNIKWRKDHNWIQQPKIPFWSAP